MVAAQVVDEEVQAFEADDTAGGLGAALILALVLLLMIGAFIWFVIKIDPLTSDFIDGDAPLATATYTADEN